ncbi:MAG: carboxypeptidase-like regulatory domain-containing protein, partial [Elusimicrobia bacterium]|nr:carboxypeptidase-like regulatory domain-containing protein [Elusimicrobiota bacterium]
GPSFPQGFAFPGLPDGAYYLRAYRDQDDNQVQDAGEACGAFGPSLSSPTAVVVLGGVSDRPAGVVVAMGDPAVGSIRGQLYYGGSQNAGHTVRVEAGRCPSQNPGCDVFRDLTVYASSVVAVAPGAEYRIDMLPPATGYFVRAYEDANANRAADVMEAKVSSGTLTVNAGLAAILPLNLSVPGSGALGNSTLRGKVYYEGAQKGEVFFGFSRSASFSNMDYVLRLPSTGSYSQSVMGGATYYMAGFLDADASGNPDGGEATAVGAPESYGGTPGFDNPPAIYVPLGGATTAELTLLDPPSGEIHGRVTYGGAAPLAAPLVVNAYRPGGSGPNNGGQTFLTRRTGVSAYDFSLGFLAAATDYLVSAYVDSNGNGRGDNGEPWGSFGPCTGTNQCGTPVGVSSGSGAYPAWGIDFAVGDPGSLGGAMSSGRIRTNVTYLGTRDGDVVVRLFDNASCAGLAVRVERAAMAAGPGSVEVDIQNIPFGTYWLDAYRGWGEYNSVYHAYGRLNGGAAVAVSQSRPEAYAFGGDISDPGQGGSVNVFSGRADLPAGARFDGGATDIGVLIALSSGTPGEPSLRVLGVTKQYLGTETLIVRYSSVAAGAGVSSRTLASSGGEGPEALIADTAGRVFIGGRLEAGYSGGMTTATLTRLDSDFNVTGFTPAGGVGSFRSIASSGTPGAHVFAAGYAAQETGIKVVKYVPDTLVAVATGTYLFPACAGGSCGTDLNVLGLAVHPVTGEVYALAYRKADDFGAGRAVALLKFSADLSAVISRDVTSLNLPEDVEVNLAADPGGSLFMSFVPSGQAYAATYKFDPSLVQLASAAYSSVIVHFKGGMGNMGLDGAGHVYEVWEVPGNGGDIRLLHYDGGLRLVGQRSFDGGLGLEDFPFSLAVYDSSRVYVAGAVNNGNNLDWITLRLNGNETGSSAAAGETIAVTTQTATRAIWGRLTYGGTQVSSGTVRAVLLGPDPADAARETAVRFSTAPFGLATPYLFNNLQTGNYRIQAFIDPNENLVPDAGEPVAYSTAGGVYFATATVPNLNLAFCDRRAIALDSTVGDALCAADCPAPDHGGAYQRLYTFAGRRGQPVTMEMTATGFYDDYLMLYDPNGRLLASDDDSAGNGNARISNLVLPADGLYTIAASAYQGTTGAFKLQLKGSQATLGSISGDVEYLGSQGGNILVALFNGPDFSTASALAYQVLSTTRAFTFLDLPTGTSYYLGAFADVNANLAPDDGEDGGNFGGTEQDGGLKAPIFLQSGQAVKGARITIYPRAVSGQAYITGVISSSGTRFGPVRVELWSNSSFQGLPSALRELPGGAGAYDAAVPGGVSYFIRAYMDLDGDFQQDPDEPKGAYSPNRQGVEALYAGMGAYIQNADFELRDPWAATAGAAGEGTAFIGPKSTAAGTQFFTAEITYTAGASGIAADGKVGFVVPAGFAWPEWGAAVTAEIVGGGALAVTKQGQSAFASPGIALASGQQIKFTYGPTWAPCLTSTAVFSVVSAQNGQVAPQALFAGAADLTLAVVPGPAAMVQPANPFFSLKRGALSGAQTLEARDLCGNRAAVASDETVLLRAKRFSQTTYLYDAYDDAVGLSTSPTLALSTEVAVGFAAGRSTAAYYVLANSTGYRSIEAFFDLTGQATFYYGFSVLPENALTGVSISTAASDLGGTYAVITPNNDGAEDQAFVNFRLGDAAQGWHVLVSSMPFKEGVWPSPVWESWGWGQPGLGSVAWDGRYSPWLNNGVRVPNGLYYLRVEVGGYGGIHDDRLSARVTVPQLAGRFYDLGNGQPPYAPLAKARINIYGSNGSMYTETDGGGNYFFSGVAAGAYNVFIGREDFLDASLSLTIDAGGAVSTFTALSAAATAYLNANLGLDVLMARAPVLSVVPSISSAAFGVSFSSAGENWGNVMVRSSGTTVFAQTLFSPMRLPSGSTTFDDGGHWDAGLSTFVVRTNLKFNVAVGTYSVEAAFAGFDKSTATVFVPALGARVLLPEFARKSSIYGTVTVPANIEGRQISVSAGPTSTMSVAGGGYGGVYLPAGVPSGPYRIFSLDPGTYTVRANTGGYAALVTTVAVPASSDVAVNFGAFSEGAQITGTVVVGGDTSGQTPVLYVNAWAPNSSNFGSTMVYVTGGNSADPVVYTLKGLDAGATYQLYARVETGTSLRLEADRELPLLVVTEAAPAPCSFNFIESSGVLRGTILLPAGASDFLSVDMVRKVVASARPDEVGREEIVPAFPTMADINFRCQPGDAALNGLGYCPADQSTGTFAVYNLNTETMDITLLYKRTGEVRKQRVAAVNGSTTTVFIDLTAQTYSISGSIINQISNPLFNTNPKLAANATNYAPVGWPAALPTSLARVLAVRQDAASYNVAISTVYDAANTRVGFLNEGGLFTISSVPAGVYYVRTENLRSCATCAIAVPAVGATVRVSSNVSALNIVLRDGYSVSGTISLDGGIQDARVLRATLRNRRQEVVRSTYVYLGDAAAGLTANAVDYSFSNLPANDFYSLTVEGTQYPVKYVGLPVRFPDPGLAANGLATNLPGQNVLMRRAAYLVGRLKDAVTGELINVANANLLAPSFQITATANPWTEGGYAVAPS